jgi:hypothetical protein
MFVNALIAQLISFSIIFVNLFPQVLIENKLNSLEVSKRENPFSFPQNETTVNVLSLCATNTTYKAKNLSDVVHYIYEQFDQQSVDTNYYYVGIDMIIQNIYDPIDARDGCRADLTSTVTPFNEKCGYSENMFDVVISEYCPAFSSMSVFNTHSLQIIKNILKPNGYLIFIASEKDNFIYTINGRGVNIVEYMQQTQHYENMGKIQIQKRHFHIFKNQK